MIGTTEAIIIGGVVLLLFGAKKLPELAKSMGQSKAAFDEGLKEAAKKGKNVTRDGLCEVAKDALVKLQTYENVVEKEANESGARDAQWINPAFGKGWHSVGI